MILALFGTFGLILIPSRLYNSLALSIQKVNRAQEHENEKEEEKNLTESKSVKSEGFIFASKSRKSEN